MDALGNQPQKTTNSPWKPAQANLQDILSKAKTLGDNTSLFAPVSSAQTPVLQNAVANSQTPTQAATTINPLLAQTNANYGTGAATLGNLARGGATNVDMNPYLDSVLKHSNQLTADSVNQQFSGAGRYGSGAQTTALANSIGNQNNTALTNQWNTQQTNAQNAATTLANGGISAAGLAPQVDAANLAKQNSGIGAAQQLDTNATATQQAPLTAAAYEANLTQPIANSGGTSTTVQQSNPITTALGGAIGIGSLFSGGANSAVSGMMALSDERAKENIRDVGKTHDGQKIYSYNYKGDPRPTLGLLAQEVEEKHPEAVGRAGNMKTVNYREATKHAARGKVKNASSLGALAG